MATVLDPRDSLGIYITGELRSVKPGKAWKDRDGNTHDPVLVRLLLGDEVVRVEFRTVEAAESALDGAEAGALVTLPVGARAKGKDWLQWFSRGD